MMIMVASGIYSLYVVRLHHGHRADLALVINSVLRNKKAILLSAVYRALTGRTY